MTTSKSGCWFHGKVSRQTAEHILESVPGAKDGVFIVRESISSPGHYVLCLKCRNVHHHFQIVNHGDAWFSIDSGPVFQGLDDLVHHYSQAADGLPTQLKNFVPGLPPPPTTRKRAETELHKAVASNDLHLVKKLLGSPYTSKIGDTNSRKEDGSTPLHEATRRGYVDILKLLLASNPDVHIRDSSGATPLHVACQHGQSAAGLVLIEKGKAIVQERNSKTEWVPLHEAALRGHVDCCRVLLTHHAPLQPRTPDGDKPRDLALRYQKNEVVELLDTVQANYPPPCTTTSEWLHKRCDRNRAVQMLQQHGATDGMFLVRPNSRHPGCYALTLFLNEQSYHYEIVSESDRWYYIDDGPMFDSLERVISHYSSFADGLPTMLKTPVSPPGGGQSLLNTARMPLDPKQLFQNQQSPGVAPRPPRRPPLPPSREHSGPVEQVVESNASSQHRQALIDAKDISLGEELGEGEFGSVLKGKWTSPEGKVYKVAVKTLHKETMATGSKEFLREADIMKGLDHPCIVRLLGVVLGSGMMLVQELISFGSLINYLQDTVSHPAPDLVTLKLWAAEIASGMTYLESKRFVHRDLAARNILVASLKQVKISDFGLSRAVGANSNYYQASQGGRWPVKWYAPESVNYGTFSSASDVWSYGVTLWEMFSYGQQPYGDKTGAEVLEYVEQGGRLECPTSCPRFIYDQMMACWSLDSNERPTFHKLHTIFLDSPEYRSVPHKELYATVHTT